MALFDFFRKNTQSSGEKVNDLGERGTQVVEESIREEVTPRLPTREIPEHVFIEYAKPTPASMDSTESKADVNNLQTLYRFLEQSYEKKGYDDALMNPDTSYLEQSILYIRNELGLTISKVKTYYASYLRQVNFHIETRKRNGMIETVEELVAHRETIEEEIRIVANIEEDAGKSTGLCANLFLGYTRGFKNGFAAITYNKVLGTNNKE